MNFHLGRWYRYSIYALGALFIICGGLVAIGDAFAGFSVIVLTNAFLCFAYGLNRIIDTESRKVLHHRDSITGIECIVG